MDESEDEISELLMVPMVILDSFTNNSGQDLVVHFNNESIILQKDKTVLKQPIAFEHVQQPGFAFIAHFMVEAAKDPTVVLPYHHIKMGVESVIAHNSSRYYIFAMKAAKDQKPTTRADRIAYRFNSHNIFSENIHFSIEFKKNASFKDQAELLCALVYH